MKKTQKKGFTLVELLVVIAILAILATVSVVGYTTFIDKANESNAITELTQIRDVVNASIIDGKEEVNIGGTPAVTVNFTYSNDTLKAMVGEGDSATAATAAQVQAAILELSEITLDSGKTLTAVVGTDGKVTSVTYKYAEGVEATWTIETNAVAIKEN